MDNVRSRRRTNVSDNQRHSNTGARRSRPNISRQTPDVHALEASLPTTQQTPVPAPQPNYLAEQTSLFDPLSPASTTTDDSTAGFDLLAESVDQTFVAEQLPSDAELQSEAQSDSSDAGVSSSQPAVMSASTGHEGAEVTQAASEGGTGSSAQQESTALAEREAGVAAGEGATGSEISAQGTVDESSFSEEGAELQQGPSATQAQAAPSLERREKKVQLPPVIVPRTGNIRTPQVRSPPRPALERSEEIRKRTGVPPELHHARLRQLVQHITDIAREGQRRVVWRIEMLSKDTRTSIEELTFRIFGFIRTVIRRLDDAITSAKAAIQRSVDDQILHFDIYQSLIGEELAENRDTTTEEVHNQLLGGSEELGIAHNEIQWEFSPYLDEAQNNIMSIPDEGRVVEVTPPPSPPPRPTPEAGEQPASEACPPSSAETGTNTEQSTNAEQTGQNTEPRNLLTVRNELQARLESMEALDPVGRFVVTRTRPVFQRDAEALQRRLETAGVKQAESMNGMRAQFTNSALRLVTPVAENMSRDCPRDQAAVSYEYQTELEQLEAASRANQEVILEKRDGVFRHLDDVLQPRLASNLRKAGSKVIKGIRDQAQMAEVALFNSSGPIADAYPDFMVRIAMLVPPDRFLDSEKLGPQLREALESLRKLPDTQYEAVKEKADEVYQQSRDAQLKQIESLGKAADGSIQSVSDVVTATQFDFALFSYNATGVMSEGGREAIDAAQDYALRVAEDLLKTKDQAGGALQSLIRSFVGSMNEQIQQAGENYYEAVDDFQESMIKEPDGVFKRIDKDTRDDLGERSGALDNALPHRSTGVTAGLAASGYVTLGIGTLAAGAYLYWTDADEDVVFEQIGELPWPGAPALAHHFEHPLEGPGYGNLINRIDDSMDADDATHAKALFSSEAATRAAGRLAVAEETLSVWGPSDEARESLLRGFGDEERRAADEAQVEHLANELRDDLSGTELRISESYLSGNPAGALAARMEDNLRRARRRGDDEIFQAIGNIEDTARDELKFTEFGASTSPEEINAITSDAMREFAASRRNEKRSAETITEEEARNTFIEFATADRTLPSSGGAGYHDGGYAHHPPRTIPVNQRVKDYVRDVLTHGFESEEAWDAKAAYEFEHAERDWGGPSESSAMRFTLAFENQSLYRLERERREHPDRREELLPQIKQARERHDERMARVARRLDPTLTDEQLAQAGGPTEWMARRSETMFAGGENVADRDEQKREEYSSAEDAAAYAGELIRGGRSSLVSGIRYSTRGLGTNEELLRHSYTGRSREETEAARRIWQAEYDEDLYEMLGIGRREWTNEEIALAIAAPIPSMFIMGGETSGDLAFELEILARGEPETDKDYAEIAALRYNQQRHRGTGFLASLTMSGTPEAERLDASHEALARELLRTARERAPYNRDLPVGPEGVFTPDGRINPEVARLAFPDRTGPDGDLIRNEFRGDRSRLFNMTNDLRRAGDRYREQIDYQESLFTSAITAIAMAVSLLLLVVPGVNVVAAGVLTALISGAATMAVKYGMRGERYGWEEAATDLAMTGIEVASAGIGGAMAGGLGSKGLVVGKLAGFGGVLQKSFGKVGATIIREAITGAVSSAAQVAIQDETWKKGPGEGFEKTLGAGMKGAAVSAVSAGVSEVLGDKLTRSLAAPLTEGDPLSLMQRAGSILGPHGSAMVKEGISEALGSAAGETVAVYADIVNGQYRGNLADALNRIGQAGLRDMVTATARGGIMSVNKARYNAMLAEARSAGDLSPDDLRALQLAGISAGEIQYGEGVDKVRTEVMGGRDVLQLLPPDLRQHTESFDAETLTKVVDMLESGDLGDVDQRQDFVRDLSEKIPGFDGATFLRELSAASEGIRGIELEARIETEHQQQIRNDLVSGLDDPVQRSMRGVSLEGIDRLPEADIKQAAEMVTRGVFDSETADALLRAAKAEDPDLNEFTFLKNLAVAVETSRLAQDAERAVRILERKQVMASVPDEAIKIFADMPDESVSRVKALLDQESAGSPQQQDALFRAAQAENPELTREQFSEFMDAAVAQVKQQNAEVRSIAREERQRHMSNVPETLRGELSVLPDDALIELRVRQMEGGDLSPAERQRLLDAAQRETPGVDIERLSEALDEILAAPPQRIVSGTEEADMRSELEGAIPSDQREQIKDVPIVVMRPDEFESFTRSTTGEAVTLIIDGRPVVIIREGVDPVVLREEGIHVLQSKDPAWAERIGSLDERKLAQWDQLPLQEQLALYRNKIDIEIDAQQRLLTDLEAQSSRSMSDEEAAKLRQQIELAKATLDNLGSRRSEAGEIDALKQRQIEAGIRPRPDWLEQPARLFGKKKTVYIPVEIKTKPEEETQKLVEELEETGIKELADVVRLLPSDLDTEQARKMAAGVRLLLDADFTADEISSLARMLVTGTEGTVSVADQARILAESLGDLLARDKKTTLQRFANLKDLVQKFAAFEGTGFSEMHRGQLRDLALDGRSPLDVATNKGSIKAVADFLDTAGHLLEVSPDIDQEQVINALGRISRSTDRNYALSEFAKAMEQFIPHLNKESLDIITGLFAADPKKFHERAAPAIDNLFKTLAGQEDLARDLLKAASFMAESFEFMKKQIALVQAINNSDDPVSMMQKLHDYVRMATEGDGDVGYLESLQLMGHQAGARPSDDIVTALDAQERFKGVQVTIEPKPELTQRPVDEADTPEGWDEFARKWHDFLISRQTPEGFREIQVSKSYEDFREFLRSSEKGLGMDETQLLDALATILKNLPESELTVKGVRHAFKEHFKEKITAWVLFGDPNDTRTPDKFDAKDENTLSQSRERLQRLTTAGLNVNEQSKFAEAWYANYREITTGRAPTTQAVLREADNESMVDDKVPSTPSETRRPDFADPPDLGDVKSHAGGLGDKDEIRLRAYLNAVSQSGGAKVMKGGETLPGEFTRVPVVFTNMEGARNSSKVLQGLFDDYPDRFRIIVFDPGTGQRIEIDKAKLDRLMNEQNATTIKELLDKRWPPPKQ